MKTLLLSAFFLFTANRLSAQVTVTGTVFDSSKRNYVENVMVVGAGGTLVARQGRHGVVLIGCFTDPDPNLFSDSA